MLIAQISDLHIGFDSPTAEDPNLHRLDEVLRQLEAMATRPALQGRGIGTEVLRAVNDHIVDACELGALDTGSEWFYRRLGWLRWRGAAFVRTADGVFRTEDEDGNIMVLPTPASGPLDVEASITCDWRPGDVW